MTLVEFLRARLDEDELIARDAGRVGGVAVPGGAHWHWVTTDRDLPVTPNPDVEYVQDVLPESTWIEVSLRSVEKAPSRVGPLPEIVLHSEDELKTIHALHLMRWDPARVLTDIAGKRELITLAFEPASVNDGDKGCCHTAEEIRDGLCDFAPPQTPYWYPVLGVLARPYVDHPAFDPKWRG